ncbi:MAG: ATP-binding protein [Kiritimatiellia bacterium]
MMGDSLLQLYFETDSWLCLAFAIACLGALWIYQRRILAKVKLQHQELTENEHWLNEAQQIGNIGSWYCNVSNGIVRWSPQFYRMLKVPENTEASFEKLYDAIHPDDRTQVQRSIRRIEKTGESEVIKFRILYGDGAVSYMENRINCTFGHNNRVNAIYGSVLDVTERMAYEDSLKRIVEEAESANKAKGAFLSTVSHEIRTPLNAIIGFSTLMAEQDLSKEQYKSYSESINAAGKSLGALINDVLDLSALESLSFTLVPMDVDIHRVLDDVKSVFKLTTAEKGITLNVEIDDNISRVLIDGKRLRQILINIVGNAVKFTSKGGVYVRAEVEQQEDRRDNCDLVFTISDSGIGINETDRSRIFNEFEQASGDINRKFGGSGLGLSIVTQLLNLMGGAIELESEAGKGSTFTVKFFNVPLTEMNTSSKASRKTELFVERYMGEFRSLSSKQKSNMPQKQTDADDLFGLDSESFNKLRHAFKPRFITLSQGVNIEFARQLSADLHTWAVKENNEALLAFSKNFFRIISNMNVKELLKISNAIAAAED